MRKLKVLCVACRTPLYWYTGSFEEGSKPRTEDFIPYTSGILKPAAGEAMCCSKCGSAWYLTNFKGSMFLLTNEGIKPREPEGVPKLFTPDPMGYIVPELPQDFHSTTELDHRD